MNPKRRNRLNEQFSPRLISMLESPAYRGLSRSAHLVISRIEVELAHHGGNDNGRLGRLPFMIDKGAVHCSRTLIAAVAFGDA